MARLMAKEQAGYAAPKGMQKLGGYGHATEYDMERHLRAAVVFSALCEGATRSGGTSAAGFTAFDEDPAHPADLNGRTWVSD